MINHIGLFVKDFEPMLKFYEEIFSFKKHHSFSVEPKNIKELFGIDCSAEAWVLETENLRLELIKLSHIITEVKEKLQYGYHHLAIKTDNPDTIIKKAKKYGTPIVQTYKGDHMIYFVKDPEGNSIEVSEARKS